MSPCRKKATHVQKQNYVNYTMSPFNKLTALYNPNILMFHSRRRIVRKYIKSESTSILYNAL